MMEATRRDYTNTPPSEFVKDQVQTPGCIMIDYQPGNMTRYIVIFTNLPGGQSMLDGRRIMTVMIGTKGYSMLVSGSHWSYVKEKTGMGEADARAVGALLEELGF